MRFIPWEFLLVLALGGTLLFAAEENLSAPKEEVAPHENASKVPS